LVDIINLHADPRAFQRAQNAETQRMQRANRGSLEEEKDQRCARRVIPGVIYRESAQRAAAREDGVTRQNENNQRRFRRNAPGAVERESTQCAAVREEPGVQEHESAQQVAAREDGVTRQNENNQQRSRCNAPGV
jgi:hypothetical protein